MTVSSASRALLALLLAAGISCAASARAPHDLAPDFNQDGGNGGVAVEPDSVAVEPQETISEGPVSSTSPVDSFGTLEGGHGALPGDIWRGSTREETDALLMQMRTGVGNAGLKDLLTRLLLTQAAPPQGSGVQSWFTLRVGALIAMGEDEKAEQMIGSLPASMKDASMLKLEAGLELIRGEYDHACKKAQPDALPADENGEDFWRKLVILCQAHAGRQDEAMVGIDLMREERHTDDMFFQEAIRRIGDRNATIRSNPEHWTLLNVALLRLAGDSEKLKNNMDYFPPVALKYLAQDDSLDIRLRDRATGRAQQLGVLPVPEENATPEQPFSRSLASDVTTLVRALGSDDAAGSSDNAVIARLALEDAGIGDLRRVQRLLTLMEPFGYHAPPEVWAKLFAHRERFDGEMPPATLVARINEAAAGGGRGEVIVLAGLITGGSDVDKTPDLALLPVLKALKAVGFEKEARALAHDAVKRYSSR